MRINITKPKYGWCKLIFTLNKRKPYKKQEVLFHLSEVYSPLQEIIDKLRLFRFRKQIEIEIDQEGSYSIMKIRNQGYNLKISFYDDLFYLGDVVVNKKEFIIEFKKSLIDFKKKSDRQGFNDFWFRMSDLRKF